MAYIDEILNKSIFDYLNDKYNNQNKVYEKQLEILKNTKIKDIKLQCFTDNNGKLLTFDIYTSNNEDCKINNNYKYQKLEDFKWILENAISPHVVTCRINEIIKSHYCRNILSSYLYNITSDDISVPIDIDIKSLELYENTRCQAGQIKELLEKVNNHEKKLENQEKRMKDLIANNKHSKIFMFEMNIIIFITYIIGLFLI